MQLFDQLRLGAGHEYAGLAGTCTSMCIGQTGAVSNSCGIVVATMWNVISWGKHQYGAGRSSLSGQGKRGRLHSIRIKSITFNERLNGAFAFFRPSSNQARGWVEASSSTKHVNCFFIPILFIF